MDECVSRLRLFEQQKLIQTSLDGFWVVDTKDARILEANEAFCRMVGYSREELLGMCISDLEADESPAETAAHLNKIMGVGHDRFETRHRHKHGHLVNIELSVSHSKLDGGTNFVFARDITERKRMEQVIAAREQELRSVADSAPFSIIRYDLNGRMRYMNSPMLQYFEIPATELIGKLPREVWPDGHFAEIDRGIAQVLETEAEVVVEFSELSAEGKTLHHQVWLVPERDTLGEVVGIIAFGLNITERKQAEALLVQREREFRTLAENMPDALIRYDREGRRTYVNPALKRISAVREEQMIGLTQQESNPFIMPDIYRRAVEHALATGERSELELPIPTPSGDIRTNLIFIAAERAADGQITGAITIGHDITERKQAEDLLAQREREFRTLAENMPDNIARYNREGKTVYVNPVLERTLGDGVAAMIGTSVREYQSDGSYEDYAQLLDTVLASGAAGELEKILPGQDEETRVHQLRVVPERGENGEVVGVLAIGRDITEQKRAEQNLRESEIRFRSLFESATDCMLILDMGGRIVDINRTGYERLGYQEEEMLGRRIAEFDTPEYAPLVADRLSKLGKEGTAVLESAHVCKDGSIMPVEINTRTIQLGGESRYFSVIRDITQRKQAERQLRELTMHLQTVREEEKAHLAREIHDDLGSTLAALNLRLSHLLDVEFSGEMKNTPLFTRLASMSPLLENAIAATRRIITDMRPDVLDNLGLFAALEWQAERFHKHTGIGCRVVCANDHGCADCKDCAHQLDNTLSINLFRIFQEALSNIARHSGASSVEAEYRVGSGNVILSISDNGCGLPEGHTPASTSFGIRGMRERIGQLGGQINFDRPLGGGLCVTVKLPLAAGNTGTAMPR